MASASYPTTSVGQRRSFAAGLVPAIGLAIFSFIAIYQFGVVLLLAGIVGIGVLWLVLVKPELATLVILFVMYTNAAAVAVRVHHVPAPFAMGVFLLLFIPVLNYVVLRREGIRTDRVFWLMALLSVIMIASAIVSHNPGESTETITNYVVEGMVTYFLMINTVRTPDVLRKACWVVLTAAALLGTLTLYQYATRSYENEYGGFASVQVVKANGEVNFSRVDTEDVGRGAERLRAFGPVADPNIYGVIMVAALPFALVPAFSAGSRTIRIVAAVACIPIGGAIVLTFSRGAAMAVVILGVYMFSLRYFKVWHALLFVAAISVLVGSIPDYRDRILTLTGLQSHQMRETESSVADRAMILNAGFARFMQHPVLGVGPGQSPDYVGTYDQSRQYVLVRKVPLHNTYLQQLVETGAPGFVCFMAIIFFAVRNLLRASRYWLKKKPDYAHIATTLMLALIAFLSAIIFLHMAFVLLRYYALLLGLGGAAVLVYRSEVTTGPGTVVAEQR
jgi:O-antigen ligase/polysaccharide polymerase Wzy-like membrane protein